MKLKCVLKFAAISVALMLTGTRLAAGYSSLVPYFVDGDIKSSSSSYSATIFGWHTGSSTSLVIRVTAVVRELGGGPIIAEYQAIMNIEHSGDAEVVYSDAGFSGSPDVSTGGSPYQEGTLNLTYTPDGLSEPYYEIELVVECSGGAEIDVDAGGSITWN